MKIKNTILLVNILLFAGCAKESSDDELLINIENNIIGIEVDKSMPIFNLVSIKKFKDNYYILNNSEKKVYKTDSNFNILKEYGGVGEGPDEFNKYLVDMDSDSKGNLYIIDRDGLITVINSDLEFIENINLFNNKTKNLIKPNYIGSNNLKIIDDKYILTGACLNFMTGSKNNVIAGYLFTIQGEFQKLYMLENLDIESDLKMEFSFVTVIDNNILFTLRHYNKIYITDFDGNLLQSSDYISIDKYFKPKKVTDNFVKSIPLFTKGLSLIKNILYTLFLLVLITTCRTFLFMIKIINY